VERMNHIPAKPTSTTIAAMIHACEFDFGFDFDFRFLFAITHFLSRA
jgi:hypothetical protein